jgi:hypothetical protein
VRADASGGRRAFARLVGAVGLVTLTALLFWMLTDDAFRVTDASVRFEGLHHADEAEVRALLQDLDRAPNVFRVRASDIVSRLSELTEVDAAYATVMLPAEVRVRLDERDAVFVWSNRAVSWLVDDEGMLFAPADAPEPADDEAAGADDESPAADDGEEDAADAADDVPDESAEASEETDGPSDELDARAALPVIFDDRQVEPPEVGSYLPALDLAVMRQLLALTPELLGSSSAALQLRVEDTLGYTLRSADYAWVAVFGHYLPMTHPPEVVPRQVQCLEWLLARYEDTLVRTWLMPSDEACGTFTTFKPEPDGNG